MKVYIGVLVVAVFLVLTSCESELSYFPESADKSLVMYSFLQADSTFQFHLSTSSGLNALESERMAPNGLLSLFENDVRIVQMPYFSTSSWVFVPSIQTKAGNKYTVVYTSESADSVLGTSTIPLSVSVIKVDTFKVSSSVDSVLLCKLYFKDPIHIVNKYQLVIDYWAEIDGADSLIYSSLPYIKSDKQFLTSIEISGSFWSGVDFEGLFVDDGIDGTVYGLNCSVPHRLLVGKRQNSKSYLNFKLFSLSDEYYEYYKSRRIVEGYNNIPFLNPVKVYSNVENGLGCIGGFSVDTLRLYLK